MVAPRGFPDRTNPPSAGTVLREGLTVPNVSQDSESEHLYRTFEALRGEERLVKREPQGEDPDIDAIVEAYADTVRGLEPSAGLFQRRRRLERNVAVLFMVDMSGSTKGWINEVQRESLVLLCESLELLGDRYAICGFSGHFQPLRLHPGGQRRQAALSGLRHLSADYLLIRVAPGPVGRSPVVSILGRVA